MATAASRTGRDGGHFVGHMLGLHTVDRASAQRSGLGLAPLVEMPLAGAILPIAVLADLAPAAALRAGVDLGPLTATASMSLAWRAASDVTPPVVRARAEMIGAVAGWGSGRCALEAPNGRVVAVGQATYALVRQTTGGVSPPPWESRTRLPARMDALDRPAWVADAANQLIAGMEHSAVLAGWDTIAGLDHSSWRATADGEFTITLENGPMQRNRAGNVQGGVLYAAAGVAAGWAAVGGPCECPAIMSGTLYYMRPGAAPLLQVCCRRLRTGSSSVIVAVSVLDGDGPIAEGHFLMARRGDGEASRR